ncbi:ribbon-helix-helix protein, CopG family [Occultella kanbiaonis]|uniref:ribbon-helix-helix protein, CopG family n=1 Tax=Occultella kanbiaonis TaxID=2675754 RepID=UPI0013D4DFAF|nr:ribbon-helix-helix protein, CopG family [Occultella kanbiaonis]
MANTDRYRPAPDAVHRDARPDEEPSRADVDRIVREARSNAGRPSLSGPGVKSPTLNVRLPAKMRAELDAVAAKQGKRPSEVARAAVAEYLAKR